MRSAIIFSIAILLLILPFQVNSMPKIMSHIETEFGTYEPYISDVQPSIKPYTIAPNLSNVSNLNKFQFTETEKKMLAKNGFSASPSNFKQVYDIYNYCQKHNIPIFVTTDSLLHVYHILYDYTLRIIESREFFNDLENLNADMLKQSISQLESAKTAFAKSAAQKNIAFFSVASVLLNPKVTVPSIVKDIVNAELSLIDNHAGFSESPIFGYEEDYSQYVPRGHYTRSEKLERFFRSMMWYGRISFRITPREGEEKGMMETLQAILITSAMKNARINGEPAISTWDRIYAPTVFFVGKADDLTIYEYTELMADVYGNDFGSLSPDELANQDKIREFIKSAKKLRSPMISSSWVWEGENIEDVTKGFRFMGQRFIPDSYMFQQLVIDAVSGRAIPKGLDIMAIMGSERAFDILVNVYKEDRYGGYVDQIKKLRSYFAKMDDEVWAQNLYWNWLYVLMPLLYPKTNGYPVFMQNPAWLDKDLNTALGSWAELRHDTILYAKQSYTKVTSMPTGPQLTKGYVEPNPELYARLAALVKFTMNGLSRRGLLLPEFADKFVQLEELLLSLKEISELELTNQPLTRDQYGIIVNIGNTLESITKFPPEIAGEIENQEDKEMAIIADVHTDPNSGSVLEVGVGYPHNIFVIVPIDGELRIAQGGIFSYYEFTQPMDNRLTDGQWQKILSTNPPDLQIWVESFIDLSAIKKVTSFINFESEMGWHPVEIHVIIKPEVANIGDKIEVRADIFGNIDSPPKVTVKQGDTILEKDMIDESGYYYAIIDTKNLKPGNTKLTVNAKIGEEEFVYNKEITITQASAVEINNDVALESKKTPLKNRVYMSYPNPFNPEVWIPYELSQNANVTIEIYNALGQLIRTLDLGYKYSGKYLSVNKAAHWDGRNSNGEYVSSGIYFYKLKAGDFVVAGKMIALK